MNINEYIYLQNLLININGNYVILDSDLSNLYSCSIKKIKKLIKTSKLSNQFYFWIEFIKGNTFDRHIVFTKEGIVMLSLIINSYSSVYYCTRLMDIFILFENRPYSIKIKKEIN